MYLCVMATSFFVGAVVGTEIIRILFVVPKLYCFSGCCFICSMYKVQDTKLFTRLPNLIMYLPRNQCINLRNKLKRELKKTHVQLLCYKSCQWVSHCNVVFSAYRRFIVQLNPSFYQRTHSQRLPKRHHYDKRTSLHKLFNKIDLAP